MVFLSLWAGFTLGSLPHPLDEEIPQLELGLLGLAVFF